MDILKDLYSKSELEELKKTSGEALFKSCIRIQQNLCKDLISQKTKELDELRETLKELKNYTKVGKREKKEVKEVKSK